MASTDDIFATHRLLESFEVVPELKTAHIGRVLARSTGLRTIYEGRLHGQAAIFRHLSGPNASKIIETETAEIERVQGWMSKPPYKAVKVLYSNPDLGLIVLSHASGVSIRHAIQNSPEQRLHYVEQAALWLREYSNPSRKAGAFPKPSYMRRLSSIIEQKLERKHQTLWGQLRDAMDKRAVEDLADCVLAQTHGDFHPSNVVVQDATITGFDLGGSHFMPLAKDASRFLVALQTSVPQKGVPLKFGIPADQFDIFCDVLQFDAQHQDEILPFLIGFDILHRGPQRKKAKPDRIKRSVVIARNYLKDAT